MKLRSTNDFVIDYDERLDAIRHTIKNHDIDLVGWQTLLLTGTEFMERSSCKRWLSDNRLLRTHTKETESWINGVWLPRTINAGWNTWALVQRGDVLTKLQYSRFVLSFAEMGVTVKIFDLPTEAERWLRDLRHRS